MNFAAAPLHSASQFVRQRASHGLYHFTTQELADDLNVSLTAARSALRRLKNKNLVASPYRGFHVVLPPEHQNLGCLPAEQFIPQLMEHLEVPYYAGLLTAARYHGAAHQQPQVFQVITLKNRPPIHCGRVRVSWVARRNVTRVPTVAIKTPRGFLKVSSPEATAYDLVGYPEHCGGLDHVATVLAELGEAMAPRRMVEIAHLSPVPWSQRLGYILEQVGQQSLSESLAATLARRITKFAPLIPGQAVESNTKDDRWKLWINAKLEQDL